MKEGEKNETAGKSTQEFSDVATFALLNFQKAYQDNGFTILDVPNPIKPPSPDGDIAFMHPSIREILFYNQQFSALKAVIALPTVR